METQNNKSGYIWVLVVLVLAFFAYSMWKPAPTTNQTVDNATPIENNGDEAEKMDAPSTAATNPADTMMQTEKKPAIEVTVKASNFAYDVKEIKAKKGDTVQINFVNEEGFHDWVLDEFNAKTKQLPAEGKESITFVADKTGTFEYYCSVGKHRAMGMVGKLIVE